MGFSEKCIYKFSIYQLNHLEAIFFLEIEIFKKSIETEVFVTENEIRDRRSRRGIERKYFRFWRNRK